MTQFTKSFIRRFIIDLFVLGLVLRVVESFIIAALVDRMEGSGTGLLITVAVISAVLGMLVVYLVASTSIGTVFKKGCYDYPQDTDKWFRNFAFIMIGLNVVSSLANYMQYRERLNKLYERLNAYEDRYGIILNDSIQKTRDTLSSQNTTLIICLILQNIIGIAILFLLLPKLKKKYKES